MLIGCSFVFWTDLSSGWAAEKRAAAAKEAAEAEVSGGLGQPVQLAYI